MRYRLRVCENIASLLRTPLCGCGGVALYGDDRGPPAPRELLAHEGGCSAEQGLRNISASIAAARD